jgi:hypothetical protein
MPNILVITGPQGSGNHLYSKALSLHHSVSGWDDLLREYWINHDAAPFKDIWSKPETIKEFNWTTRENWVLSVSGPYVDIIDGQKQTVYPNYKEVLSELSKVGNLQVGIIGRDQNIMAQGQLRKRGVESYHNFLNKIEDLTAYPHVFLSVELLYLFRHEYLKSLDDLLNIPVDASDERLHYILNKDPNAKYVHSVEHSWLDKRKRDGLLNDNSLPHDESDVK